MAMRKQLVAGASAIVIMFTMAGAVMRMTPSDLPRLNERLEALRPSNPLAYFELAEEVADGATTIEDRTLARTLFGLSGALDRNRFGRSACLALADFEEDPAQKRRLLALADLLDDGTSLQRRDQRLQRQAIDPAAAFAVAQALHEYRQGSGTRALRALEQAGAMELLHAYDDALRGGARRFLEDCALYRSGDPPALSADDVSRMLHLEAALLAGADRNWTDELLLTNGSTLIEVDPDQIADALRVDVNRPVFREGRWREVTDARR
jgi:hypothetical protein